MPRNLLDTHTLIWYLNGDKELSGNAKTAIESENVVNFVSIVSLWEIAIKISLDKLELKTPFNQIHVQIEANGFQLLPVTFQDTLTVSTLAFHHRDPFDRLLIAQSFTNRLDIISKDRIFGSYNAAVIW